MEERTFFEKGDVKVTNARFIVGSQTYAMNGVTSVKSHVIEPSRLGPFLALVVGILIILGADGVMKLVGLAIAALAGLILKGQKEIYAVVLNSSSGEAQALSGTDSDHINGVVSALNEALVHRG